MYTSKISQQDYSSLISKGVDVKSTMSFEMTAGMKASAGITAGMAKAAASVAQKFGGVKGKAVGSVVNVALENTDNDSILVGGEVEASKSRTLESFARSSAQASSAFKINQKEVKISEFTIGGVSVASMIFVFGAGCGLP